MHELAAPPSAGHGRCRSTDLCSHVPLHGKVAIGQNVQVYWTTWITEYLIICDLAVKRKPSLCTIMLFTRKHEFIQFCKKLLNFTFWQTLNLWWLLYQNMSSLLPKVLVCEIWTREDQWSNIRKSQIQTIIMFFSIQYIYNYVCLMDNNSAME